jgi:hypothetical protein
VALYGALSQIARQLPQSRCHWLLGVPVARASSSSCCSDSQAHITNITVTVTLPMTRTLMACAIGFKFSLPVDSLGLAAGSSVEAAAGGSSWLDVRLGRVVTLQPVVDIGTTRRFLPDQEIPRRAARDY